MGYNNKVKNKFLSCSLKTLFLFYLGLDNITSFVVSNELKISLTHASNTLSRMYKKGWLKRQNNPYVSNGYIYGLTETGINILRWMKKKNLHVGKIAIEDRLLTNRLIDYNLHYRSSSEKKKNI